LLGIRVLQMAYSAYQHTLYSLPNPKVSAQHASVNESFLTVKQENPKLWYGIGILYDRYESLDNAEEAFSSVLKMDKGTLIHSRLQFYISFN
jgi:general transcriptional corepressor CYC8